MPVAPPPCGSHILPMSQTLASLVLFALMGWIFFTVRRISQESAPMRRRILFLCGIGCGAALFLAFVVPRWVPETPVSPGTLVVIALLWVMAAMIIFTALPAFLAALIARPKATEELE